MLDKGSKDMRESNPARVNIKVHSSREAVAGDNVRVPTLAGRSSKNPNHVFPSFITNPRVGSFAAEIRELVRDVVDGVAFDDCITSMNGDVITELFDVSLSTPKDIDAFTSNLELGAKFSIPKKVVETDVLKESLTMGVPLIKGTGYTIETVTVEYEWKPPRCDLCKIFGHVHDHCPKKVSSPPTVVTSNIVTSIVEKTNDGFQTVGKKRRRATTSVPKKGATNAGNASKSSSMLKTTGTSSEKGKFTTSNPYYALDDESEEDVENVYDESTNLFPNSKTSGSSSFKAAVD
ncbi:hypothetical protein Tco_1157896 [Tanacetum coccineum]